MNWVTFGLVFGGGSGLGRNFHTLECDGGCLQKSKHRNREKYVTALYNGGSVNHRRNCFKGLYTGLPTFASTALRIG